MHAFITSLLWLSPLFSPSLRVSKWLLYFSHLYRWTFRTSNPEWASGWPQGWTGCWVWEESGFTSSRPWLDWEFLEDRDWVSGSSHLLAPSPCSVNAVSPTESIHSVSIGLLSDCLALRHVRSCGPQKCFTQVPSKTSPIKEFHPGFWGPGLREGRGNSWLQHSSLLWT